MPQSTRAESQALLPPVPPPAPTPHPPPLTYPSRPPHRVAGAGVALRVGSPQALGGRGCPGLALGVRGVAGPRGVRVEDRGDARLEWKLRAGEPPGVAVTVAALVVRADQLRTFPEGRED